MDTWIYITLIVAVVLAVVAIFWHYTDDWQDNDDLPMD